MMIGKLTGNAEILNDSSLIINCNGVGYLVACTSRTRELAKQQQEQLSLHTTMLVRDDAIELFGFSERKEQEWFNLLKKIPGVGPRLSLQILSTLAPHFPGYYVAKGDEKAFLAVSGVGKKLAFRLVSELKAHADAEQELSHDQATTPSLTQTPIITDAISALTNLGYQKAEAEKAIENVQAKEGDISHTSKMIKLALQEIRSITS